MGGRTISSLIQRRRRRLGKPALWPRTVVAPSRADYARVLLGRNATRQRTTVSVAPVAQGVARVSTAPSRTAIDGGEVVISAVAAGSTGGVDKVYSVILNPADAGIFQRMSQVANVYNKFRCLQLQLHYAPTCATTQAGQVAFCFRPDVDAAEGPTSFDDIVQQGGGFTTNAWQSKTFPVPPAAVSRAFGENYTRIPVNQTDQEQINTCGRLYWCVHNVPTASVVLGDLKLQYTFRFADPKPPAVKSAIGGKYVVGNQATGAWDLDGLYSVLSEGYHMFGDTDVADVYSVRGPGHKLLLMVAHDSAGAAAPTFVVEVGPTPGDLTARAAVMYNENAVAKYTHGVYVLTPADKYISVSSNKNLDDAGLDLLTTCLSDVQFH